MNSLPASPDANTPTWPWSPSDRLRIEKCTASVTQHSQSLALFCTSADFLSHNSQMLVDQLTAQMPELVVEYFSGEKSQPLLAKINERLADLSIDLAMKTGAITTPAKIWVIDNAQSLAVHELSLVQRLLKYFPSFGVSLILLFTGPEQALPQSNEPGTRIESWNIPWTAPGTSQTSSPLKMSPTSWAAVAAGLTLIAAGLAWQSLVPSSAANSPDNAPAAPPAAATSEAAAASEAPAASEANLASTAPAASLASTASEAFQQATSTATPTTTPSATIALQAPAKAAPSTTEAALAQPASTPGSDASTAKSGHSASTQQEALPNAAVKGVRWLHTLPKESFVIEHGQFSTAGKAQQLIRSKAWLATARIVPVYERDQDGVQFSVVTGPFRSQERAQTFKARQELPITSKIRPLSNVMAHSQAPGSKAKHADKTR